MPVTYAVELDKLIEIQKMSFAPLYMILNIKLKFTASFLAYKFVLFIYDWFIEGSPWYWIRKTVHEWFWTIKDILTT